MEFLAVPAKTGGHSSDVPRIDPYDKAYVVEGQIGSVARVCLARCLPMIGMQALGMGMICQHLDHAAIRHGVAPALPDHPSQFLR